jgi:hypothetical protein
LPEGTTVNFNGVPLRLSYIGGTGNDVVLAAPPLGGFYDWGGAGGNAAWSTNANWVGGVAPPPLTTDGREIRTGGRHLRAQHRCAVDGQSNRHGPASSYAISGSSDHACRRGRPQVNVTGRRSRFSAPSRWA